MQIANCIITSDCRESTSNLIELWARESGQSSEHMTINLIVSNRQLGNQYAVTATLFLPSIWSSSDVSLLQLGLAKALATHFKLALSEVHVITSIISPGMVVESGQEIKW